MAPDVTQLPLWWDESPQGAVEDPPSDRGSAAARTWDVVIVGAGIAGLLAADRLLGSGRTVCLLDADAVGRGVSSQATVKVTPGHGVLTADLVQRHGEDEATRYQRLQDAGFRTLASLVEQLPEDVGWATAPHQVQVGTARRRQEIDTLVRIAQEAGTPHSRTEGRLGARGPGIGYEESAVVHPVRLLHSLARRVRRSGACLVQHAAVVGVDDSGSGGVLTVRTRDGLTARAGHVLVATHTPAVDPDLHTFRMRVLRHYAIALPVAERAGSTLTVDDDGTWSTRDVELPDGRPGVVVVGNAHRTGAEQPLNPWSVLAAWAHQRLPTSAPTHRWASQDLTPPDHLPYVGPTRRNERILVETGFRSWGFTTAAAAADMIVDTLDGKDGVPPAWSARRLAVRHGGGPLVADGAWTARSLVGGYARLAVRPLTADDDPTALRPGEGKVVGSALDPVAVSRDDDGALLAVSARCTHVGCIVHWNRWARSWDCPCHGSRFAADGTVLHGPATSPLPSRQA